MSELILPRFQELIECSQVICEGEELFLEIKSKNLLRNTDPGRKERAKNDVRTKPIRSTLYDRAKNLWFIEYDFRAYPSVENKRHWGYIMYDDNKSDIKEMFCDCKDFFYRLYAPMVKKKLANWNLDWQFKQNPNKEAKNPSEKITDRRWVSKENKFKKRIIKPHNHKWTVQTNPDGKIYVCKHLAALFDNYLY